MISMQESFILSSSFIYGVIFVFTLYYFSSLILIYIFCKKVDKNSKSKTNHLKIYDYDKDLFFYTYGLRDNLGRYVFLFKNKDECLKDNQHLIKKLIKLSFLHQNTINTYIMPLIESFSEIVSTLPASERHHNCGLYGLFRHSLFVAIESILLIHKEFYKEETKHKEELILLAIVLSFCHDLGKLITDVKIYDCKNNTYNYLRDHNVQNLKGLVEKPFLFLDFNDYRASLHDNDNILEKNYNLFFMLHKDLFTNILMHISTNKFKEIEYIVKKADCLSVLNIKSIVSRPLSLPLYLKALLQYEVNKNINNDKDSDFFISNIGLLIKYNSNFYHRVIISLHELKSGSNLDNPNILLKNSKVELCKSNLIKQEGPYAITSWFKVDLNKESSLLIKAIYINIDIENENLNIVPLGKNPLCIKEINSYLDSINKDKERLNSVLVLNSYFNSDFLVDKDKLPLLSYFYHEETNDKDELLDKRKKEKAKIKRESQSLIKSQIKKQETRESLIIKDSEIILKENDSNDDLYLDLNLDNYKNEKSNPDNLNLKKIKSLLDDENDIKTLKKDDLDKIKNVLSNKNINSIFDKANTKKDFFKSDLFSDIEKKYDLSSLYTMDQDKNTLKKKKEKLSL